MPLHPWEWSEEPWSHIHIAYVGPFLWNMFLVLVDTYSKWLDVHITRSSTSQITIEKMSQTFGNMGLPKMVVLDNDTAFTSSEFQDFMKQNGIIHRRSTPYHPSSIIQCTIFKETNWINRVPSKQVPTPL